MKNSFHLNFITMSADFSKTIYYDGYSTYNSLPMCIHNCRRETTSNFIVLTNQKAGKSEINGVFFFGRTTKAHESWAESALTLMYVDSYRLSRELKCAPAYVNKKLSPSRRSKLNCLLQCSGPLNLLSCYKI